MEFGENNKKGTLLPYNGYSYTKKSDENEPHQMGVFATKSPLVQGRCHFQSDGKHLH